MKLYSTLSEQPLKRNCLFAKNYRFIDFLRASGQKFAARLSKLQSSFTEEHFWRKLLLEKNYEFIIVFRSAGENFLTGLSKLHSIFSENHFWRKLLYETIYGFIDLVRAPSEKFLEGLSKLHSIFSEEHCGRSFFVKNLYLYNFLRAWVENILAALSKLNSTVPEKLFWKSFCFEKNIGSEIFFGLLVTIFWQDFQNWILFFQKNFLREKVCWKSFIISWMFFGLRLKFFMAGLSKLLSIISEEHFSWNFLFEKVIGS